MSNFYWASSIAELQGIDPLDTVGDDTSVLLAAGDQALLFVTGKLCMMYLRESSGASDDSYNVVVPATNPGDFWWECMAVLGETLTGVLSGDSLTLPFGVEMALPGWTLGSREAYSVAFEREWRSYAPPLTNASLNGFNQNVCAAEYKGWLYLVGTYEAIRIHSETLEGELIPKYYDRTSDDSSFGDKFVYHSSFKQYMVTIANETSVLGDTLAHVYDMENLTYHSYPVNQTGDKYYISSANSWGRSNQVGWEGKIYMFGGNPVTPDREGNYAQAYDFFNDSWEDLTALPWGDYSLHYAVDRVNGYIYIHSSQYSDSGNQFYRYNIGTGNWEGPYTVNANLGGVHGKRGLVEDGKVYFWIPGYKLTYDITGNTWDTQVVTSQTCYSTPFKWRGNWFNTDYLTSPTRFASITHMPLDWPYTMTKD